MKKIFTSLMMAVFMVFGAEAQTLNVVTDNITYAFPASQTGNMTYQDGQTLTIMGQTFAISDISKMYVDDSDVTDNTVSVNYNGTSATMTIAGNVAQYVTPTITNAHVSIVQSTDVSDDTCDTCGNGGQGGPGGNTGGSSSGSSSVLISCPGLTSGSSYTMTSGSSSSTVTAMLKGSNGGRP